MCCKLSAMWEPTGGFVAVYPSSFLCTQIQAIAHARKKAKFFAWSNLIIAETKPHNIGMHICVCSCVRVPRGFAFHLPLSLLCCAASPLTDENTPSTLTNQLARGWYTRTRQGPRRSVRLNQGTFLLRPSLSVRSPVRMHPLKLCTSTSVA